jgi:hypothetical protein
MGNRNSGRPPLYELPSNGPPPAPTSAPPGSPEKIEVLAARVEAHVDLWHSADLGQLPDALGQPVKMVMNADGSGRVIPLGPVVRLQGQPDPEPADSEADLDPVADLDGEERPWRRRGA